MNYEKLDQIVTELSQLKPQENGYIFFKLLRNKVVDFNELSKSYVKALEADRTEVYDKLMNSTTNLSQYDTMEMLDVDCKKPKEADLVLSVKSAEALINSGLYKDTLYETNLKERISQIQQKHPKLHIFKYPPYSA